MRRYIAAALVGVAFAATGADVWRIVVATACMVAALRLATDGDES